MNSTELIRNFLSERLGVESERIHDDASLADLGVDSLMAAELIFEVEDQFNISIEDSMTLPATVGELKAVLNLHIEQKTSQA